MPIQSENSFGKNWKKKTSNQKSRQIPARGYRTGPSRVLLLQRDIMPPRKSSSSAAKKPSLLVVEKDEEEDRHAVEMLRRLEDLGVDLPSKSMAPETLRNHKRDPLGFVAIASQLATIIEPLIEMTGADNPTLARRSCETIRTLGPGTSEEDRASRALGALAVLAVGQMMMIAFGETSRRRRRPFFFAT